MKLNIPILLASCILISSFSFSQQKPVYTWWNPAYSGFPVIEGQAWPKEVKATYDRFPARAEKTVPEEVWNLSANSAGLYIKFKTDAKKISVRYGVKGKLAFPHMPATGVSGLDLYGTDPDGNWFWSPGKYSFGDTIQYTFSSLP
ncbi:MAG: SGNH/GDSL hydrolase N-terminal domain-containing protein, partial [Flavitalea sp.]